MIKLLIARGEAAQEEHEVHKSTAGIGPSSENEVGLVDQDRRVSGKHARIERHGDAYVLIDLGSKNGTYVRDQRIEPHQPIELKSGDRFSIEDFVIQFIAVEDSYESTILRSDPQRKAVSLADELGVLYAKHSSIDPRERMEAIKNVLRAELTGVSPENAKTVLARLRARFEPAGDGGGRGAWRSDEETGIEEAMDRAALRSMRNLAERFAESSEFRTARDIERFALLLEETIQATVERLSRGLRERSELAEQISPDLTALFSREGKAIKNAVPDTGHMGKFLLDWQSTDDVKEKRAALDELFQNLAMHEIGMLSGFQSCLESVLSRLDPRRIMDEVRAEAGKLRLAAEKKAWRRYLEDQHELFQDARRLRNDVIYPSLKVGYLASRQGRGAGGPGRPPEEVTR